MNGGIGSPAALVAGTPPGPGAGGVAAGRASLGTPPVSGPDVDNAALAGAWSSNVVAGGEAEPWVLAVVLGALLRPDPHGLVPKCGVDGNEPPLPAELPPRQFWERPPRKDIYSLLVELKRASSRSGSFLCGQTSGKQVQRVGFSRAVQASRAALQTADRAMLHSQHGLCGGDVDHALGVAELFAKEFAGTAAVLYRERHVERDTQAAAPAIVLGFPARNKMVGGLGYTLLPLAMVEHSARTAAVLGGLGATEETLRADAASRKAEGDRAVRLWRAALGALQPARVDGAGKCEEHLTACLRALQDAFVPALSRAWQSVQLNGHRDPAFKKAALGDYLENVQLQLMAGQGLGSNGAVDAGNITAVCRSASQGDQGAMVKLIHMIASDESHRQHAEAFVKMGDDVMKGEKGTYFMLVTAIDMAAKWKQGLLTLANTRAAGEERAGDGGGAGATST